jgi:hypothetical protein
MTEDEDTEDARVEAFEVGPLTPHTKAVLEAGKTLLIDSVTAGREFCKFMVTTAFGAIPIYIAVLKLRTGQAKIDDVVLSVVAILPIGLFLASAILFSVAYFPTLAKFSLDIVEQIECELRAALWRRQRLVIVSLSLFIIGTVAATGIVMVVS